MAINILKDEVQEKVGVYAKEQCSIPAGMGKYIPVQTNQEIHGDVIVETNDRTVAGLILPEIVYRVKRKLGCIFIENHNSTSLDLQPGQTTGCMNSCIVKQGEWGQQPELRKKITPSVNDTDTCVGGASRSDAKKAGQRPCVIEQSNDMDACIGGASRHDAE